MYDNLDLFYLHQQKRLEEDRRRPHCDYCGEPIWSDKVLKLPHDGSLMCDGCIEECQEWVEEY